MNWKGRRKSRSRDRQNRGSCRGLPPFPSFYHYASLASSSQSLSNEKSCALLYPVAGTGSSGKRENLPTFCGGTDNSPFWAGDRSASPGWQGQAVCGGISRAGRGRAGQTRRAALWRSLPGGHSPPRGAPRG